jgi:hypothetical protein
MLDVRAQLIDFGWSKGAYTAFILIIAPQMVS